MAGIVARQVPTERMVHIRFEGRSWQVPLAALASASGGYLGDADTVKRAVAAYLDIAPARLAAYIVEWHPSGNVTVRPEAVFG